jgi:hypothetical protein
VVKKIEYDDDGNKMEFIWDGDDVYIEKKKDKDGKPVETIYNNETGEIVVKTLDDKNNKVVEKIYPDGSKIIRKINFFTKESYCEEYDKNNRQIINSSKKIDENGNEIIQTDNNNNIIIKDISGSITQISKDENNNEIKKTYDKNLSKFTIEKTDENGNKITKKNK